MGHDGKTMVTPNAFTRNSTIYDFNAGAVRDLVSVGEAPIATGMMPDDSKYYVANFLDSTISVINTVTGAVIKTIPLLANYDPITGRITGPVGALPIQTPVSPDGRVMVTANILTDTITIVDTTRTRWSLPCPATPDATACSGERRRRRLLCLCQQQFSNTLQVIVPDPTGSGDLTSAAVWAEFSEDAADHRHRRSHRRQ